MKLALLINLLSYLYVPQMLAEEGIMVKEMEIQEIENLACIIVDEGEILRLAHTIILHDIVNQTIGRNIPRN